jgi:hypothetical protein
MAKYSLYKLSSNVGIYGGASKPTGKTFTIDKGIGRAGVIKHLQDQGILSPRRRYSAAISDNLITILSDKGTPLWKLTKEASESKASQLLSLIGEKKGVFWETETYIESTQDKPRTNFKRGQAKTPTAYDLYGQHILDAISKIRKDAFENYERINGPTRMSDISDARLGIESLIKRLREVV